VELAEQKFPPSPQSQGLGKKFPLRKKTLISTHLVSSSGLGDIMLEKVPLVS